MNHSITSTHLAALLPTCPAIAASRGPVGAAAYELTPECDGAVLYAYSDGRMVRAWDIGSEAAPLQAQAAQLIADKAAADEAARIAAEANPPVPFAVSRRQLFLALAAIGVTRAAIRAMIEATPDAAAREAGLIEFDEAIHFERGHPLIAQLGAALGRSESQIDDLFRSAANL